MSRLRTVRRVLMMVGALVAAGCYTYVPVDDPTPGTTVRVRVPVTSAVTRPGMRDESFTVEGKVISHSDSLVLATETRTHLGAYRELRSVDTLRMDPAKLASIDEKVYSQGRTIALTAGIVGGAVGVALGINSVAGGGEGGGPPDDGTNPSTSIVLNPVVSALLKLVGG